jgi:hypothetical protein
MKTIFWRRCRGTKKNNLPRQLGAIKRNTRCARSMCRAGSSMDAHTWPSAGHARCVLSQAFYALTESWNDSGRGSRHPAPLRMKKWRAEPPRDQPGANSHASCSPAERRQETAGARPAAMAELRLLYVPVLRRGGAPRRWRGGARPADMAENSPSSRSRRGDASHASPCLAERRHKKAAGARPAAMSERSWSSRSRRHLPCVPASGRAEAVDGSRSSAGRHGRELLDTPASLPRAGRATASPTAGAVCEAARWVDLPWVKRIPAAHTTVSWPRGSPAAPHRRRRG